MHFTGHVMRKGSASHEMREQGEQQSRSPAPKTRGRRGMPARASFFRAAFHRERLANYRGAGAELAAGQSESRVSLVSGTGMSESGTRSWFQSKWGSVSTMQGKAKSVSRE